MEYYAIFIPDKEPVFSIKGFYVDKAEALSVLKQNKEARMKAFASSEEAVYFYLNGPSDTFNKTVTVTTPSSIKSLFVAPTSQKLVAFRKMIEANNIAEVTATIRNPRYLVSSGDTPTILKEGPRYNALHITAIEGRAEICRLILQTIENSSYIERLHGQRTNSTDEVSTILLDLYLNTPDKCRSETPLHFAAKHGSVDVVRELIAYPQCQVTPNSDGLYPREIICSRAKPHCATPEVREAIRCLLEERFFVPLVRYEDNLIPPVVGKPFTPTRTATVPIVEESRSSTLSPKGEVKAYAGPMDRSKADSFYRRWKTPPRLVVLGAERMDRVHSSEQLGLRACSTPIKLRTQPRQLFANRSLDNDENNTADDDSLLERSLSNSSLLSNGNEEEAPVEEDTNGNHVRLMAPAVASTPFRLFHQYRQLARDDMDNSTDSDAGSIGEVSFSYLCDKTRTLYDRSRLCETPTHRERSLRLSNIDKGLETLGRTLASNESVGWKEYWNFLGKFCDLTSGEGLQLFEEYLANASEPQSTPDKEGKPGSPAGSALEQQQQPEVGDPVNANTSISVLCDGMQKFTIREASSQGIGDCQPLEVIPHQQQQQQVSNPYLCVTSSLKVFATRFVMNMENKAPQPNGANTGVSSLSHIVKKLDAMVDNFRSDSVFRDIDFHKAHKLFVWLVLSLASDHSSTRNVPWLGLLSSSNVNNNSFECIRTLLLSTLRDRGRVPTKLAVDSEADCRRLWLEESLITPCDCNYVPTLNGSSRRTNVRLKRHEERVKRLMMDIGPANASPAPGNNLVVDFSTYRSIQAIPSPTSTPPALTAINRSDSSEDEDIYLRCSNTDQEEEEDEHAQNVGLQNGTIHSNDDEDVFFTSPSSPTRRSKAFTWDTNNNTAAAQPMATDSPTLVDDDGGDATAQTFISGTAAPTKQDFDVWTALVGVEIDRGQYPHVHAWMEAMRDHIATTSSSNHDAEQQRRPHLLNFSTEAIDCLENRLRPFL
ncbi:ankyrin repeat and LEM domain-containing protein 2 homolog [Anopheles ziemanni]|uniref:ankyrin repeat and LEM domain-containing protein 2 homolog n=1 Tax=Anopheles coustani TaxID=139045 RepID=UPI0026585E53|nr:ankyrin repeat and LEM domain-containing protein 2 homolog [Anopheles coustani]XP_058170576.1 ankyrin repeat and LEM domain-containing protein 2 homolog [Anopheles ziemanni]